MANICDTQYKVTGSRKAVADLWNTLQELEVNSNNVYLYLLAEHYGIDYEKKGTLSHRNVHAKTGSFTAINCLAGYLKARNGHEIAFAIMNQNALSGREARAFQDAVCDEMIR